MDCFCPGFISRLVYCVNSGFPWEKANDTF